MSAQLATDRDYLTIICQWIDILIVCSLPVWSPINLEILLSWPMLYMVSFIIPTSTWCNIKKCFHQVVWPLTVYLVVADMLCSCLLLWLIYLLTFSVFFCYSAVPGLQSKLHELCKIHIAQQVCSSIVLLRVVSISVSVEEYSVMRIQSDFVFAFFAIDRSGRVFMRPKICH